LIYKSQKENSDKLPFSPFSQTTQMVDASKHSKTKYTGCNPPLQTPTLLDGTNTLANKLGSVWMGLLYHLHTPVQFTNLIGQIFQYHGADEMVFCFKFLCIAILSKMMDVGGSKDKKHMLGKKHVLTCFQLI
jgi:hypothetical protein